MEYIVMAFALVIGSAAIWFSLKFMRLYFRVKKWHRAEATIISKELFIHPKYSTSRSPYGIKANYRYHFDGIEYDGHMIYLIELVNGQANHMKSDAEKKLNSIREIMQVYVDPADPKRSVMFCSGVGLYLFVLCMGVFSLLIALSIAL